MPDRTIGVRSARGEETIMDKDRVEGLGKQVKGSIKEAVGKLTGDTRTEVDGKAEKVTGHVQNKTGEMKDGVRDKLK